MGAKKPDERLGRQEGLRLLSTIKSMSYRASWISSTLLPLGRSKQTVTVSFTRIQLPGLRSRSARISFKTTGWPPCAMCLGVRSEEDTPELQSLAYLVCPPFP